MDSRNLERANENDRFKMTALELYIVKTNWFHHGWLYLYVSLVPNVYSLSNHLLECAFNRTISCHWHSSQPTNNAGSFNHRDNCSIPPRWKLHNGINLVIFQQLIIGYFNNEKNTFDEYRWSVRCPVSNGPRNRANLLDHRCGRDSRQWFSLCRIQNYKHSSS